MDIKTHRLILEVVKGLNKQGSWTGKTHVQKTIALLSTMSQEIGPKFVLYKHGPYSFDLADEIDLMVSYAALNLEPVPPYGVQLTIAGNAEFIERSAEISQDLAGKIQRVASFVGNRGVSQLERLATAAWIYRQEGIADRSMAAARLHALKPHIPKNEAFEGIRRGPDHLQPRSRVPGTKRLS